MKILSSTVFVGREVRVTIGQEVTSLLNLSVFGQLRHALLAV